jgi:signal transduction histidine kinase
VAGDEHVVSYTPVAPLGWALVMEEAWRAMGGPLLRGTELVPFVLLPVLAVALAGLWFGARQVVRPLQRLAANTTALGRGEFDAVAEPVGGIGEIRLLQAELAGMARRLRMAQQGLRDYLGALTTGQEEGRRRLARELHDDTLQSLIALNQRIQLAQQTTDPATAARLAEMETMAGEAMAELRRLMRALRPSYLDDLGLAPALELLAREATESLGMPVAFRLAGEARRLTPAVELAFYRVAQEALRNVGRHARANSATVTLAFGDRLTTLTIGDDGVGFDAAQRPAELAAGGHFGLLGAAERAEAVGARLMVESTPGQGTKISCILQESQI